MKISIKQKAGAHKKKKKTDSFDFFNIMSIGLERVEGGMLSNII
jgi:hypothetical protein